MTESFKITGLKELDKALVRLEAKVSKKITRQGIAEAAKLFRREMRARAPKKTGDLRRNIRFKLRSNYGRGFTGKVGVSSKAFYARFIEYGTSPHRIPNEFVGRGRNKRKNNVSFNGRVYTVINHPGTTARPFLRPAYEATKRRAIDAVGEKIWELIKANT